jgi:hypothetical protein
MAILSLEDAFPAPAAPTKTSGPSGLLSLTDAFAKPEPVQEEPVSYDPMTGIPIGLSSLPTPKKTGSVFENLTPEQLKALPSGNALPPPSSPERRAYDSATPEERSLLAKKFPKIKAIDDIYKDYDQQVQARKGPLTDILGEPYILDTRLENRSKALRTQGLAPEFAESTAKMMAKRGYQGNRQGAGAGSGQHCRHTEGRYGNG